jgi:hypothetical protein
MTGFQGRNLFIFSQASGGDGGIAWPAVKTRPTGFGSQKMRFFNIAQNSGHFCPVFCRLHGG